MKKENIKYIKYFEELEKIEDKFHKQINKLEKKMAKETGIEDIEFFRSPDGDGICGIGNVSRTLELIHRW